MDLRKLSLRCYNGVYLYCKRLDYILRTVVIKGLRRVSDKITRAINPKWGTVSKVIYTYITGGARSLRSFCYCTTIFIVTSFIVTPANNIEL